MIPCSSLDDYLADALTGVQRDEFADHMSRCSECRTAVADYHRLVNLLSAAADLDSIPAGLTSRVRGRIRAGRRRRMAMVAGALAAVIAVAVWLRHASVEPHVSTVVPPAPVAARPSEPVRVTFPGGNVIAVREPMTSPNVTFVWVYPNLSTNARPTANRSRR